MRFHRLLAGSIFGGLLLWGSAGLAQNYVNLSKSPGWQSDCPRIEVDTAGNIHVVWAEIYTLSGVYFTSGDAFYSGYNIVTEQWSTPINLSNSGQVANGEGYLVDIDSDSEGNVYVVYVNGNRILLRVLSGGGWSSADEIGSSPSTIDQVRVAVRPNGDIFTCWWEIASGTCYSRAWIRGDWEPIKQISPAGVRSKFPDIAVGTNVAYCAFMGVVDGTYRVIVTSRPLTFGAIWTSPKRATSSVEQEQQPAVAIDASDVAHILYTPELDSGRVVRYIFGTTGGFSAPIDLTVKENLHYPAIYANGNKLYACWRGAAGVGYAYRTGAAWTKPAVLPGTGDVLYLTDIATNPGQNKVYFVWESGSGYGTEIFWSGPLPVSGNTPPQAAFSFAPATAIFPADITFDASSSRDPDGSIAQYAWNFGDGEVGTGKTITHTYRTFGRFTVKLTVTDDMGATGSVTKTVDILHLFQPLNIQVESHPDESLFRVRYLNIVKWEKNPANDSIGATISTYRVYRKAKTDPDSAFAAIGDVPGTTFAYTDKVKNAAERDLYVYTVTSLNNEGKESPILRSSGGPPPEPLRPTHIRKGKLKN